VICSIIVAKTGRLPRPSETVVGSNVDLIPVGDEGLVARIGAGDCFTGAFAAALGAGTPAQAARTFANAAAALSVTRPGAAPSMPFKRPSS
jgi:sugar/nucleoside kinase (ribokinase family)